MHEKLEMILSLQDLTEGEISLAMGEDTAQLVTPGRTRRSSSYTEPGHHLHSDALPAHYRAGLGGGCCHLEDTAALRMIVVRLILYLFCDPFS